MSSFRAKDAMEPLVFAILKALTPKDIECIFFDDRLEEIPYDDPTDLVAITVETFTAKRAYEISSIFRSKNIKVIMGGFHPTFMPDEAIKFCDSIVCGDAEEIWPKILADLKNNSLLPIYRQINYPSISGIIPDRSIFAKKKYIGLTLLQFNRGCRFACDFCSIHAFYGTTIRQRPIPDVISEIRTTNKKIFFFVDDNFLSDVVSAKKLMKELIPLKIKWAGQISIDVTNDPELLELMRRSGCFACIVGLETLNSNNLKQMKKGWNLKYGPYPEALKKFSSFGIMVLGTFVIGYDEDDQSTIHETIRFAKKNKLFLAHFNPLAPTPGTSLYKRLQQENRLIEDPWWLSDNYSYGDAFFWPKKMSAREFKNQCFLARQKFNTISSILLRLLNPAHFRSLTNVYVYLLANIITKIEVKKKQGALLGVKQIRTIIENNTH